MRKLNLLIKLAVYIILLDRWVFGPIAVAAKHKGPWVVVKTTATPPRRARKGQKGKQTVSNPLSKKLIAGFTGGAILVVAVIVLATIALYNRFAPAPVKEVVQPAPTA